MKKLLVFLAVGMILIFSGCKRAAYQESVLEIEAGDVADAQAEDPQAAVKEEEEFDYTGGSLLSTTEIKWLTMEAGATADEVRFNWFSPSASAGKVEWKNEATGEVWETGAEHAPSVNRDGYYVNKAVARNLKPGEAYTYRVGNEDAWSPEYTYRVPEDTKGSLTFLVTADTQLGQSQVEEREETARRWDGVLTTITNAVPNAQFLLHLGDHVACFGSGRDYELFLDHMALYSIPLVPVVGNHDVPNIWSIEESGYPDGPYFYEQLNVPNRSDLGQTTPESMDGNYYFIRGDVLFIILNDECVDVGEHARYVERTMAEHSDAKWKILAKHYPAFVGVESADSSDSKKWIVSVAEDYGIDLVLTGHEHAYSRTGFINRGAELLEGYDYESGSAAENPEGVLYVTCSTSSGCLYHDALVEQEQIVYQGQPGTPMALQIDVTDTELLLTAYLTEPWSVYDQYIIRKE